MTGMVRVGAAINVTFTCGAEKLVARIHSNIQNIHRVRALQVRMF